MNKFKIIALSAIDKFIHLYFILFCPGTNDGVSKNSYCKFVRTGPDSTTIPYFKTHYIGCNAYTLDCYK